MDYSIRRNSPTDWLKDNRAIIIVVLVAFALRVAVFAAARPWNHEVLRNTILVFDAFGYHARALGVLQSGTFASFGALRTPGYPLFLAGVYSLFGVKPAVAIFIQVVLSSFTVALVYDWARMGIGRPAAIVAAAALAVEPHTVFYTVTLMTDTLFVLIFLGSVLTLMHGLRAKRLGLFALSGLLLGLATLVKPVGQYFPIVAVVLILIYRGIAWRLRWRAIATLVVVFALAIGPWLYRNHAQYGHIGLSSIQGENLLFYGVACTEVARTGRGLEEIRAELREAAAARGASEDGNPFDNSRAYQEVALSYIRSHPMDYAVRHLHGVLNTFASLGTGRISEFLRGPSSDLPYQFFAAPGMRESIRGFLRSKTPMELVVGGVVGFIMVITYLAALGGFVALLRERRYFFVAATVIIALYFLASVGPIGQARYKLPLVPFYVTLTGRGLLGVWHLVTRRGRRVAGPSGEFAS
jgi:4-amino-4-deoxy-L-arabinose transferase-like glycosyltransferase